MLGTRTCARRPDAWRAGLQREMNLYIKRIIQSAVQAGQEAGKKELAREQYRHSKATEQLVAGFKAQAKASEDRRVAALVARVDTMCNSLQAEKEQFERHLKEVERASLAMKERAVLHEKQGKDWAAQMAALRRELDEARAQAESVAREADRERRAAVVLRDEVATLQKRLSEQEDAVRSVSKKWNDDVELMQTQLQLEVAARIAAEARALEAQDAGRRMAEQEHDEAQAFTHQGQGGAGGACAQCQEKEELVHELESAVALLNDQLSAVYREKATGDKDKEKQHARALAAVRDEMAEQLSAARDGQAFAEKVAQRLENELLKQSQIILQQQQSSRQQAGGLKRRLGAGKQHAEFKDFSADVERLTGGGKCKAPGNGTVGSHPPREALEHELGTHATNAAHTQLPAMPPAHAPPPFPVGMTRLSSARGSGGGSSANSGGGSAGGGEARLGEIRKPTPPIGGGSGRNPRSKACPSLNLSAIESADRPEAEGAGGGWRQGEVSTDRGGVGGRARLRGGRPTLPRAGAATAR